MARKISVDTLFQRLSDPDIPEEDLRRYFEVDENGSTAFGPRLSLNEAAIDLPKTAEGRARSGHLLNSLNWASRMRRRVAFNRLIGSGTYKGPVIVSEGDSWFQFPIILTDVIDHLSRDFAILSLGAAGDTMADMLGSAEYLRAIMQTNAAVLLFSAGGNDLVADGNLANHLRQYDSALPPADHLLPSFDALVSSIIQKYDRLFRQVAGQNPEIAVLCHGYDYAIPDKGRWLGKPMARRGIKKADVQRAIVEEMMDRFNGALSALADTVPQVTYVDNRGVVTESRWYDELHPTDAGYGDVAARFKQAIDTATAPRTTKKRPATAPKGRSLHLGLNFLDPNHYGGWDGELQSAEFDAEDMQALAEDVGFKTTIMKRQNVTRETVLEELTRAARDLKTGDIFLLTYAGHGGQVPDFNGDEEADRSDETWCLFDAQLIDDELAVAWSRFKPGVRVVVIADCCHSGTSIRGRNPRTTIPMDSLSGLPEGTPRLMPPMIAARTARKNRAQYRAISRSLGPIDEELLSRELNNPIACRVRLLSGCQDNQVSMDGPGNGAFTAALLATWDDGRFNGNYHRFHREIVGRMLPTQTPNHWVIGAANTIFDGQRPFAI